MFEKFDINKNDVVSIIGSGGKTTLMFTLAKELKKYGRVLVTTSTKIAMPQLSNDEKFYEDNDEIKDEKIVVLGKKISEEKIGAVDEEKLKKTADEFDFVLIEADGSKRLPYKASRQNEPVVYDFTTKTICVLPMMYYGKEIPEEKIFNYDIFIKNFGTNMLDDELILKMAKHENGLFKNAVGGKYLYINRCDKDTMELEDELSKLGILLRR